MLTSELSLTQPSICSVDTCLCLLQPVFAALHLVDVVH